MDTDYEPLNSVFIHKAILYFTSIVLVNKTRKEVNKKKPRK